MSSNFTFDLVDPAVLTQYVRAYDNEVLRNQMALGAWLPDVNNDALEYNINQSTFRDVDVAEYRPFDVQPKLTGRQGFTRVRGELVPLSRQIALTEEDTLRLNALGNAQGNRGLINQIYNDAERMVRAVKLRVELARGQLLTTGQFVLAENGLAMTADFGMPATHKPTVALAWSNPAADILGDLLAYTQLYVDDNGLEPGEIIANRTILGYMLGNTAMRQAAAFNGSTPTRINLETVAAIFAANGLPPVTIYDTVVRVDGQITRVIPIDKILFMPPAGTPLGETQWGITAEALKLASKGMIAARDAAGIVAVNLENDNPVQTFTLATGIAVPLLGNPMAIICADVIP